MPITSERGGEGLKAFANAFGVTGLLINHTWGCCNPRLKLANAFGVNETGKTALHGSRLGQRCEEIALTDVVARQ